MRAPRIVFLLAFLLAPCFPHAGVFIGSETEVSFFARSTVEDISAINRNIKPVLNTSTGDLIIKIPNTGFVFRSSLMQEHFNENYMESHKYPFSVFEGRISEAIDSLGDGTFPVTANGKLSIHGVTRTLTIRGTLTRNGEEIRLQAVFTVVMTDYNIEVPGIQVNTKDDSEIVSISLHSVLHPYKK